MPNPTVLAQLTEERDEALAEVAQLRTRLEARDRLAGRELLKLELLKDAAQRALEYLTAPNPYADPEQLLVTTVAHLEDALEANGLRALKFEITSDKN